jgi:hypothetical protein
MSDRVLGNDDIRADRTAFLRALDQAREQLGQLEGVVGVGCGHKQTGGRFADDVAIQVYVNTKRPDDALSPAQRIPKTFEGYRTDVREVPVISPTLCENDTKYEVIRGGIQLCAPGTRDFGTLGCIVKLRQDDSRDNVYLLSNKHVLYATGVGADDYIYHPWFPSDVGGVALHGEPLGPIQKLAFRENVDFSWRDQASGTVFSNRFFIDCATARIDIDCKCLGSRCTRDKIEHDTTILGLHVGGVDAPIADVRNIAIDLDIVLSSPNAPTAGTPRVFKVGRTTGRTAGIVRSINARGKDRLDPSVLMDNLIEIELDPATAPNCLGHDQFSEHGDSGSIVVDAQDRAIGLLLGSTDAATATGPMRLSYASHILPVLHHLKICIPTSGGTSPGSAGATDGTGIVGSGPAQPRGPGPRTEMAPGAAVPAGPTTPWTLPEPIPVSDGEREHMLAYRDALRETAAGRALHDAFAEVRREIGYLVRNSRPVKIAWHRHQGPAFLAHAIRHLKGEAGGIPRAHAGVARDDLLVRMGEVLARHGSNPMRAAIARHGDAVRAMLDAGDSVDEWLMVLRDREPSSSEAGR